MKIYFYIPPYEKYKKDNRHLRKAITQACQYLLVNYRNRKNMSQLEFAKKCKVSRQYISLIEGGKRMPMLDLVFDIAHGFDMNVKDFMLMLIDKVFYYKDS